MRRGREQRYLKMEAGTNRVAEDMNQLIQRTNSINDDDANDDVPVSSDHPSWGFNRKIVIDCELLNQFERF